MRKSVPISVLLIVAGVILLIFAWSETGVLTEVPSQNPLQTHNGLNVYSFNVSMSNSAVLTVINATGTYGLVPESDAVNAISGDIYAYSVAPSNSTGHNAPNLTYTGLSGNYVFIDISGAGYAPFLIMSQNAYLSSISGLLIVLSFLMVIGGVFAYPFGRKNKTVSFEQPSELPKQ